MAPPSPLCGRAYRPQPGAVFGEVGIELQRRLVQAVQELGMAEILHGDALRPGRFADVGLERRPDELVLPDDVPDDEFAVAAFPAQRRGEQRRVMLFDEHAAGGGYVPSAGVEEWLAQRRKRGDQIGREQNRVE